MNLSSRRILDLVQKIPSRNRISYWCCFGTMKPHGKSDHYQFFRCKTNGKEETVLVRDEVEIRDSVDRATRPEPHLTFPDLYNGDRRGRREYGQS